MHWFTKPVCTNCIRCMCLSCSVNELLSHLQKWTIVDGFRSKNGIIRTTFCSSEGNVLEDIDFSFIGQLILCLRNQDTIFNALVADFVSWNSHLIVRLAYVCYGCLQSADIYIVCIWQQTGNHPIYNYWEWLNTMGFICFIENDQ